MTTFITDLFTSIFTPGPTPTLLVATNVSFAALQLVFLFLLILTSSIHFVVLSFLCAGLWWSINWFASELETAKRFEKAREEKGKVEEHSNEDDGDDGDDEEPRRPRRERTADDSGTETEGREERVSPVGDRRRLHVGTTLQPEDAEGEIRKRRSLGSSTGDLSTDSEWDKVEEADTQR
ncbi:MAG: hypothetical protein LQ339_001580 [Xanthoria mediterranea]|nr:MAG: hypothetical protein LQ339_001580 [Xanthoria mediterranea]